MVINRGKEKRRAPPKSYARSTAKLWLDVCSWLLSCSLLDLSTMSYIYTYVLKRGGIAVKKLSRWIGNKNGWIPTPAIRFVYPFLNTTTPAPSHRSRQYIRL